jgi:hypothetical protein
VDAEQTYLQDAIRSIGEQFQHMGNSSTFHILQTYQAYLMSTPKHVEFEIYRKGILGKPLCVKLVRGAYLVEERRVSAEEGYESPIH